MKKRIISFISYIVLSFNSFCLANPVVPEEWTKYLDEREALVKKFQTQLIVE